MRLHDFSEWSFIPGPHQNPPEHSLGQHEIVLYSPAVIAEATLSFPGMRTVQAAEPSWREWRARWERKGHLIEVDMSLFETEPISWGGSSISSHCTVEELLNLWAAIRRQCPAVWLHNTDCEIVTPEGFEQRFR